MSEQGRISLQLTDEQRAAIKAATGKDAEKLELSVDELEERIRMDLQLRQACRGICGGVGV